MEERRLRGHLVQGQRLPNVGTYIQNPTLDYGNDLVGLSWITFDKSTGTSGNATQTIYVGVADTASSVYRSTDGEQPGLLCLVSR